MGAMQSTLPWDLFQKDHSKQTGHLSKMFRSAGVSSPATSASSIATSLSLSPSPLRRDYSSSSSSLLSSSLTSSNIMGSNAPPLYEHALVGDWDALLLRIADHPHEAHYQDKCRNLPLHVACRRQPPAKVVEALLQAHPASVLCTTLDRLTPLHFACYCGSEPPTVKLLLEQQQQQQQQQQHNNNNGDADAFCLRDMIDRRHRTPLHCVCAGFRSHHRVQVIEILLQTDPSCATAKDERGRTPFSLLAQDYAEELEEALLETCAAEQARQWCYSKGGELWEFCKVMELLLRAATSTTSTETALQDSSSKSDDSALVETETHDDDDDDDDDESPTTISSTDFSLLHAALQVEQCPSEFVRLVLKISPQEYVKMVNKDGRLPLHILAVQEPAQHAAVVCKQESTFHLATNPSSQNRSTNDLTVALLGLYPEAATVPDPNGKVPFVLALEHGKPWKSCLGPLYEAHPEVLLSSPSKNNDADKSSSQKTNSAVTQAVDRALTSLFTSVRSETIRSLRYLAPLVPSDQVNEWIHSWMERAQGSVDCTTKSSSSCCLEEEDNSNMSSWSTSTALQASALQALAMLLQHVDPKHIKADTPERALEMALPLLNHPDAANVRVGAAAVVGSSVALFPNHVDKAQQVLRETIFGDAPPQDCDATSVSTGDHSSLSAAQDEEEDIHGHDSSDDIARLHGRIAACHAILLRLQQQTQEIELSNFQRQSVKEWLQHDSAWIRRTACLVTGYLLTNAHDVKEFRSSLLKCMRATEHVSVQLCVARALSHAAQRPTTTERLFLSCKSGVSILDAALMLSLTAPSARVQCAFEEFLWCALEMGRSESNNEDENANDAASPPLPDALQAYMDLAQGDNGRIMMTLVTKTLTKLQLQHDDDAGGDDDMFLD